MHMKTTSVLLAVFFLAASSCAFSLDRTPRKEDGVASDTALPFVDIDFQRRPGFIAIAKGGYQWKFLRDGGLTVSNAALGVSHSRKDNTTDSGAVGSVGLGYNFGPKFPVTLGLMLGFGPSAELKESSSFTSGAGDAYTLEYRQKVKAYTLDVNLDYEFKTASRWIPLVGATLGAAFVSDKGSAVANNLTAGRRYEGAYGKEHSTNFMYGVRTGVRYKISDNVTFSVIGSYSRLGSVDSRSYRMAGAADSLSARTGKLKVHTMEVKAGFKISF